MSARELKEINEQSASLLAKARLAPIVNVAYGRNKIATPGTIKELAKKNRALAKVLPMEAREAAREIRAIGIHMNASGVARRAVKAKPAKPTVSVPVQSPVVAAAAARAPLSAAELAAFEEFVEPDIGAMYQAAEAAEEKVTAAGAMAKGLD